VPCVLCAILHELHALKIIIEFFISDEGKLIIDFSHESNKLMLSFSSLDVSENDVRLCDVSICLPET
jgi:hypothetical protein